MLLLNVIAISAAGALVGNELAIAAFVHPALSRLPDPMHLTGTTALARLLGRVMPFWYALVIGLTSSIALVSRYRTAHWPLLVTLSAVLWILAIVYSLTALVPINNQLASWRIDETSQAWKGLRLTWDRRHRWRVLLLGVALVLLVTGLLSSPGSF